MSRIDEDDFVKMIKNAPHRARSNDEFDDYSLLHSERPLNISHSEIVIENVPADKIYAWVMYESCNKPMHHIVQRHLQDGWDFVDRYAHPEIPVLSLHGRNKLNEFQGLSRNDSPHSWDREEKYIKRSGLVLMCKDRYDYEKEYRARNLKFDRLYEQYSPKEFNKGKDWENGDVILKIQKLEA